MSIEQEARAASVRIYPTPHAEPRNANERRSNGIAAAHRAGYVGGYVGGYIAGASREVTDEQADAAQIAFHEYVFGPDEPLTARDIGVTRQAWKVAIQAARAIADKETP